MRGFGQLVALGALFSAGTACGAMKLRMADGHPVVEGVYVDPQRTDLLDWRHERSGSGRAAISLRRPGPDPAIRARNAGVLGQAVAVPHSAEPGTQGLLPVGLFKSVYFCNSEGYVSLE